MNAVDDIATVINDLTTGYVVQKDFFNDKDGFEEFIIIRSSGGSYASLLEGQAIEIAVIGSVASGRRPRDKIELIKTRLIGYNWLTLGTGIYQCDIVGGIMPFMMSDGRTGYTLNVIARYSRDEADRT